jgi:recombination protein RecA
MDVSAVRYCEAESAFDFGYAEAMGMPLDLVDFGDEENPVITVEDLYRDLNDFLDDRMKKKKAGLYIVDSLDGLADEASLELDISKGSFSMTKQKQLSKLFSHMNRKMEKSRVNLFIVSQVRDNIGVTFGEKHRRSGGKAMDFYASQFLWLHHIGYIFREIKKVRRPIGIKIKAKVKKNKVGLPFRECEFEFIFGYGIEDIKASVKWLNEVNRLKDIDLKKDNLKKYISDLDTMDADEYAQEQEEISKVTKLVWREIETSFLPTRTKYRG